MHYVIIHGDNGETIGGEVPCTGECCEGSSSEPQQDGASE